MIILQTPNGIPVEVPENSGEDISLKFSMDNLVNAKDYYIKHGYVVVKNVLDPKKCDEIRSIWKSEVKSSRRFIYRQATAKSERNVFNDKGWVMNPILNLQSLNPKYFNKLRHISEQDVLGSQNINSCFCTLLGESPKIVQSMYFEGNSATWEHQDSYYLDSENLGSMSAAWVALENITARAGRFFVCPGSQEIELEKQNKDTNIADKHDVYIRKVVDLIKDKGMEVRAPYLEVGDVLFWHARTVHGSLNSQDIYSRSSITIHAIPSSHKFLQLQTRVLDVPTDEVNRTKIWRPKDQARLKNRIIMLVESYLPRPFYVFKRIIIKLLIK